MTLLGDLADAPRLRELAVSGAPVSDDVLTPRAVPEATGEELVCSCQAVTRARIGGAIREHALNTPEQVARHTHAGTGCGGCRTRVRALLDEVEGATASELRTEATAGTTS